MIKTKRTPSFNRKNVTAHNIADRIQNRRQFGVMGATLKAMIQHDVKSTIGDADLRAKAAAAVTAAIVTPHRIPKSTTK